MAFNNLSLVSASNENTIALAGIKTDISLIKVEVPAEYTGLDAALTSKRRTAAEEGTAHKTARRLGILFQDLLPSTPSLLRAYGRRSSEISQKAAAKLEGSATGTSGIFANFLGADITSIWAAATSGASSIAAHLLACLLARMWPASEATSIWVEIVAERKRQVAEESRDGVYKTSMELLLICQDDISRKDLAEWDAGARAWLQIADEAQMRRQKQLMLIIKNIHLPVNTEGSTYDRVLDAWTTALKAMERLLCGQPQRVGKGASLVGIASWHLYPDLLVLGESITPVRFKDDLVSDMGQLTVGLENTDPRYCDGIFWSLPLSHLRFYGDPVVAVSRTREALRFSMDELQLLVFGSAISNWGSHYLDPVKVAGFFQQLYEKVGPGHCGEPEFRWLQPLWDASKTLVSVTGDELHNALAIVALGRRNGKEFLAKKANHPPPYFGIDQPFVSALLKRTSDHVDRQDVERMRFVALQLGLRPHEAIIRVSHGYGQTAEYATAVPHSYCAIEGLGPKHGRWILPSDLPPGYGNRAYHTLQTQQSCNCHGYGHGCHAKRCECIQAKITCNRKCHTSFDELDQGCIGCSPLGDTSRPPLLNRSHGCTNLPTEEFLINPLHELCTVVNPRSLNTRLSSFDFGIGLCLGTPDAPQPCIIRSEDARGGICGCYTSEISAPTFRAIAGNPDRVALFVRIDDDPRGNLRRRLRHRIRELGQRKYYDLAEEQDKLPDEAHMKDIQGPVLRRFLQHIAHDGVVSLPQLTKDLTEARFDIHPYLESLAAFQVARSLYQSLSGATGSLRVIDRPLYAARWVDGLDLKSSNTNLSRARRFACIAFFESGVYDLNVGDFAEVIAISTRNSLYVSAVLLSDPFDTDNKIEDIRHVLGNVGKTGMVMMVAPLAPKVRRTDLAMWKRITHSRFDGSREDRFTATSLHLSFTEFEMPFDIGQRGSIDRDMHVRVVETIISVYDRADWVADLDVLLLYEPNLRGNEFVKRFEDQSTTAMEKQLCNKAHGGGGGRRQPLPLTAIDNWEELLNLPEDIGIGHVGVVRTHENWIGRLATACVAAQKGIRTVILPRRDVCWECCSWQEWKWMLTGGDSSSEDDSGERGGKPEETQESDLRSGWGASSTAPWQNEERERDDGEDSLADPDDDSDDESVESNVTVMAHDVFVAPPHVFIC
jgi:hypothetical protein